MSALLIPTVYSILKKQTNNKTMSVNQRKQRQETEIKFEILNSSLQITLAPLP